MAVGQVSFKDQKKVRAGYVQFVPERRSSCCFFPSIALAVSRNIQAYNPKVKRIHVEKRENPIVNRLNKTKVEKFPNLHQDREDRLRELRNRERAAQQARQKEELRLARERKEKAYQRDHAYDDLFTDEAMAASSNQERNADWEDDFM